MRRSKTTMADEKRYIIELGEKQLRALSYVCDMFPRLIEGQLDIALQPILEQAWERRHPEWHEAEKDAWYDMREETEEALKGMREKYWGLTGGTYYGIHYDNYADMIWDMHQVIRHALWLGHTEAQKERTRWTVDAFPASQISDEPLITVKPKEEE